MPAKQRNAPHKAFRREPKLRGRHRRKTKTDAVIDSTAVGDRPQSVEDLLLEARRELTRLLPAKAREATRQGSILIDIRSDTQRSADGIIPEATFVPRNVLEWRLDPACEHRDTALAHRAHQVILICNEGYQSSLAAATLQRFGLQATDVIGGFQAWRNAGLPVAHD
jgi:rhodanese-related sulfurtransferase